MSRDWSWWDAWRSGDPTSPSARWKPRPTAASTRTPAAGRGAQRHAHDDDPGEGKGIFW